MMNPSQITPATPDSTDGSQYQQTPPHHQPSHERDDQPYKVTRGTSCLLCQQRKVRCDKNKPCSNCVRAGAECTVIPMKPPRRHKKKVARVDLIERLRKYEQLLSSHGIPFGEPLGPDIMVVDPGTAGIEEGDELDADFIPSLKAGSPEDPDQDPNVISAPGEKPHMPKTFKWFPFQKENRAAGDRARESSDEEDVGSTINSAYDQMFTHSLEFPLGNGAGPQTLLYEHPSPERIVSLWTIYLENVNPLLKLTHTPTLDVQIFVASTNLGRVSRSMEALMFSIYLMAVTSISDDEVQARFGVPRMQLLNQYIQATQQALLNAEFMRNPDLTLVQAFLLYCMGVRQFVDPRSLFCLTGIAVRLAHRLGLHRDGAHFGLSPFEVEQRRRLWWNLAGFDRRVAEFTGSTITAISNGGDCKLPLNVNDSDLDEKATHMPRARHGATEMIFALTRLEFAKGPGSDKMTSKSSLSETNPQAVANLADQRLNNFLERFSTYFEDTYLKHIDTHNPLEYMTLLLTRMQMCKLKIMSGFFTMAVNATPQPQGSFGPSLRNHQNDALFVEAIKMLEYDMMIFSAPQLKGFYWYMYSQFPLPAYVYLLSSLRTRTTGDLCERGWKVMLDHHEKRKLMQHMRTPLHIAYAPLFVKAWDARQEAEAQQGRTILPPALIAILKRNMPPPKRQRSKSPTSGVGSGAPAAPAAPAVETPTGPSTYATFGNQSPSAPIYSHAVSGLPVPRQDSTFDGIPMGGEMDPNFLRHTFLNFDPQAQPPPGYMPTMPPPPNTGYQQWSYY